MLKFPFWKHHEPGILLIRLFVNHLIYISDTCKQKLILRKRKNYVHVLYCCMFLLQLTDWLMQSYVHL